MTLILKDRILETSTTTGTGTLTLAGAVDGYQSFAAVGDGNTCYYTIEAVDGDGLPTGDWEVGIGTYTSSGTTLSRTTVLASSNSGNAVNFGAGAKRVFVTAAADYLRGALSPIHGGEVSITGATTLTASAFGKWHRCSGTSANYTVGLPAVSGNAGKMIGFVMDGALTKLVTLDGNSSETIDGATTRVMWARESAVLMCNGSEWNKISGRTIPMECVMRLTSPMNPVASGTLTAVTLNGTDVDNTGLMADAANNRMVIRRAGNYLAMGTISVMSTTGVGITQAGSRFIAYIERNESGVVYRQSENSGASGSYPHPSFTSLAPFSQGDTVKLKGFQDTGVNQAFNGTAAADACILSLVERPQW